MKIPRIFFRAGRRAQIPAVMLLTLLQRTPLVRPALELGARGGPAPVAAWLRAAATAFASLGALHTLAGATILVASQPSPLTVPAGTAIVPLGLAEAGTVGQPQSWSVSGALPPGLSFQGGATTGVINNAANLLLSGAPTAPGTYALALQAAEYLNLGGLRTPIFNYTIIVTGAAVPLPNFALQPASQSVTVGETVTLTASAADAQSYQWQKNGVAIPGATSTTLALANVQLADAATYTVVATNLTGAARSSAATLAVRVAPVAPVVTLAPASQTVAAGATVMFAAGTTGTPAPVLQWLHDGVPLSGATSAMLVLTNVQPADAGAYTLVATNSAGAATSAAATLSVAVAVAPTPTRLVNLSVRTVGGTGERTLILGVTLGGGSAAPLLVRGIGPSLGGFGLAGFLAEPVLTVYRGAAVVAANGGWGGNAEIAGAAARVGAFPLASVASRDAALLARLEPGGYSVQLAPAPAAGEPGLALAELYDTTPLGDPVGKAARFINLSARAHVGTGGDILIAGFVLAGSGTKTLLLRATGPALATFGVAGALADPRLELYSDGVTVGANDDWGGRTELAAAAASVGAFPLPSPASKDAALLVSLAPGAYTVQVRGVGGTSGVALIELYELP